MAAAPTAMARIPRTASTTTASASRFTTYLRVGTIMSVVPLAANRRLLAASNRNPATIDRLRSIRLRGLVERLQIAFFVVLVRLARFAGEFAVECFANLLGRVVLVVEPIEDAPHRFGFVRHVDRLIGVLGCELLASDGILPIANVGFDVVEDVLDVIGAVALALPCTVGVASFVGHTRRTTPGGKSVSPATATRTRRSFDSAPIRSARKSALPELNGGQ